MKESDYFVDKMELNDSSSMSFGIEMSNGDMNVLIHPIRIRGEKFIHAWSSNENTPWWQEIDRD